MNVAEGPNIIGLSKPSYGTIHGRLVMVSEYCTRIHRIAMVQKKSNRFFCCKQVLLDLYPIYDAMEPK